MFTKGDIVKCIDNTDVEKILQVGKSYIVESTFAKGEQVILKNTGGSMFDCSRFVLVATDTYIREYLAKMEPLENQILQGMKATSNPKCWHTNARNSYVGMGTNAVVFKYCPDCKQEIK